MMKKEINKNTPNPKQSVRRRQRGNTLVPVVLGLGIAAVATVSFLNQGEGLIDDNTRVLAINEVTSILKDYNAIRSAGVAVGSVTNAMVPGFATTPTNIYGNANGWSATAVTVTATNPTAGGIFSYRTDSPQTCQTLLAAFTGADGVTPPTTAAGNTTNCSDANGAAPNADPNLNVILNLLLN